MVPSTVFFISVAVTFIHVSAARSPRISAETSKFSLEWCSLIKAFCYENNISCSAVYIDRGLPPFDNYMVVTPPGDKITPEELYISRRRFIAGIGMAAAGVLLSSCTGQTTGTTETTDMTTTTDICDGAQAGSPVDELGNQLTTCEDITTFNNFYEFSYAPREVAVLSQGFKTSPWTVTVGGLVENPGSYTVDELIERYQPEERIYRMRCVETWSMVVPWLGFPLNRLLQDARPKPEGEYVSLLSFYDSQQMPGDRSLPFPYFEGLRLDEAMHDLAIMATGLYGKPLPPQDGAPIRLVVPWKYGFKSAKSIMRIDVTSKKPATFWSTLYPSEYGFYANVNPDLPHPRWSQKFEHRIGENEFRSTLLFNGYDQVAPLYEGMDLTKNY
jgi:methionine sulfoxide reductase catalytic subunit